MRAHLHLQPPVRAVKGLLDRDELGEIYFASSSRVNLGLHQQDISVIWDLGPHDFSILLYWFGEMPTTVRAVGRDSIVKGVPDVAFVTLEFPSGLLANVELSWLAPSKLRRTVLVGSKRMVVYSDGASSRSRSSITAWCTRTRRRSGSTTCPTAPATSSLRGSTPPSRSPSSSRTSPARCGRGGAAGHLDLAAQRRLSDRSGGEVAAGRRHPRIARGRSHEPGSSSGSVTSR